MYFGRMDIAYRKYGNLGLAVCGTLCGIVLIYMARSVLERKLPGICKKALGAVEQSTLYILMIHKLYSKKIYIVLNDTFHLKKDNVYNVVISICLQLIVGVIVYQLIELIKCGFNAIKKTGGSIA